MEPTLPAAAAAVQLSACHGLALFHRTCAAVLLVPVAASLDVEPAEAASLAIVFFWVYALLQLPSGLLADLLGSRRLACAGSVVMGVGAVTFAAAEGLWVAVLARAITAAGCAVTFVALVRHVKTHWPVNRVATVTGRGILAGNLGTIMSCAPLAYVLLVLDWRSLSMLLGLASFALAAALWVYAADTADGECGRERVGAFLPELCCVWRNRYNRYAFVVLLGLAGAYWGFVGLCALPLLRESGLATGSAVWLVAGMMAAYAVGASVLGALGDRLDRRAATLSGACAGALVCWLLLATRAITSGAELATVLIVLGFCCGGFNIVFALVTERNPVAHAGTVVAFANVGTFTGAALLQTGASALAEDAGMQGGIIVMLLAAAISLACSVAFWTGRHPPAAQAMAAR